MENALCTQCHKKNESKHYGMAKHLLHHLTSTCRATLLMTAAMAGLSLTASATDTKYINSQADWQNIVDKYDGKEVNVILNCDVKFDKQGIQMDKFVGTLDGQGHAFVFNYKDDKDTDSKYYDEDWDEDSAPFEDAQGTIKNLRLTGTIAIRYGFSSYRESNPLVRDLEGTLTIENCLSEINFVNTGTSAAGWNRCHIGGFIGQMTSSSGKAIFKNCAFTGSFVYADKDSGHDYNDTGGFVGYQSSKAKIEIYNCFSNITYDERGTINTFSYFVGNSDTDYLTMFNAYGYCVNRSGTAVSLKDNQGEGFTDLYASEKTDFMSNGVLMMALNGDYSGIGDKWAQTLGTDATPKLKTFSNGSETLTNLVKNGDFNNGLANWINDEGDEYLTCQTTDNNTYWRTPKFFRTMLQTVDLTEHYTEEQLTNNQYDVIMACNVSLQYGCKQAYVGYSFLDASGELIGEKYGIMWSPLTDKFYSTMNWETYGSRITLPSGTRSVKIQLEGYDYKFLDGYYGPAFDNVWLALLKTGTNPTAIAPVTDNPTVTDGPRYTISGTPAGKNTKGIIIQNGKKYIMR